MPQLNNPVDILKLLNNSNCGECGESTCMAFAAAVFKGTRQLSECPHLHKDIIEQFLDKTELHKPPDQDLEESVKQLKRSGIRLVRAKLSAD